MIFNSIVEFARAGLTPDENGEYKMGMSEMARFNAYQEQKQQQRELDTERDWMDFDD